MSSATLVSGSGPLQLLVLLKVKMTMKFGHFESTQDMEAPMTAELKTILKEAFYNVSETSKNNEVGAFEERGVFCE